MIPDLWETSCFTVSQSADAQKIALHANRSYLGVNDVALARSGGSRQLSYRLAPKDQRPSTRASRPPASAL